MTGITVTPRHDAAIPVAIKKRIGVFRGAAPNIVI